MKVEAADYYGSDVHDRTRESIAQDSGNGIDFFLESQFFQSAAVYITTKLQRSMEASNFGSSKAFELQENHKTLCAYFSSSTACSEGCVWKYEHV